MYAAAWEFYAAELLRFEIDGPTVFMLDNFESHVSERGRQVVCDEA